jgi:VWFA-related protein
MLFSPVLRALGGFVLVWQPSAPPSAVAEETRWSERLDVQVVEIPAQVSRRGEPVVGLRASDFRLFENGEHREIVALDEIDLSDTLEPANADPHQPQLGPPVAARRHLVLVFDLALSHPATIAAAQKAAQGTLLLLHPTDLVAVAALSRASGPRMVLGFTTDREQLFRAVQALANPGPEPNEDPLGLLLGRPTETTPAAERPEVHRGQAVDRRSRSRSIWRGDSEQRVADVEGLLGSLEALGEGLLAVQGRKHVLLLSEGFDASLLFGADDPQRLRRLAAASVGGAHSQVDDRERFGSAELRRAADSTIEVLRKAGATLAALDLGGIGTRGEAPGFESLRYLASGTGGHVATNSNDFGSALAELLEHSRHTYLLAFVPGPASGESSFREIRVELAGESKGTEIRHLPGYFPRGHWPRLNDLGRRLSTAQEIVAGRGGGAVTVGLLAAALPAGAASARTWVPVIVEVDGSELLALADGGLIPLEILGYALDSEGRTRDFFARNLALDLAAAEPRLRTGPLSYLGHFELEPGAYTIRVLVRGGTAGVSGMAVWPLTVPSSGVPAVLPPFFPVDADSGVRLAQPAAEWPAGASYPFTVSGRAVAARTLPEVVVGDQIEFHVLVAGGPRHQYQVESTLLGSDGSAVDGVVRLESLAPGEPLSRAAAQLDASGLDPGEYLLLVALVDQHGKRLSASSLPIVVSEVRHDAR